VLLLVAGPAALIVRRRYPVAVLAGVLAATLLYMVLGYPYGPVILSPIVAVYTAVTSGHRIAAWVGTGAFYAGHMAYRALFEEPPRAMEMLAVGAWMLVILIASEVARAYQERAAEIALVHQEEARRRASEERLRIARELHDVLAHHISLMNVQAGVALHLIDRRPEQARTALTAIEQASREAMGELRSVLDILHRPEEAAPRSPAPSVERLEALQAQAAAAGLEVRLETRGERAALSAAVDAAAYRVVQEAITNVIRHAAATVAVIRLAYGMGDLTIEVEDDGVGDSEAARGEGSGIRGMRDRVEALGGRFEAGRLPGRGFRVRASLPTGGVP
jgi:signal transduction histidine kinase